MSCWEHSHVTLREHGEPGRYGGPGLHPLLTPRDGAGLTKRRPPQELVGEAFHGSLLRVGLALSAMLDRRVEPAQLRLGRLGLAAWTFRGQDSMTV